MIPVVKGNALSDIKKKIVSKIEQEDANNGMPSQLARSASKTNALGSGHKTKNDMEGLKVTDTKASAGRDASLGKCKFLY